MKKPRGIIVFGASGAGTTTLGRELARFLGFKHLDADDYYWEKTEKPYTVKRERGKRNALLDSDVREAFVISGSLLNWGTPLNLFDLGVFVETPTEIRLERLKKRELGEFGERIMLGGDMFDNHQAFLEWAASYDNGDLNMRSRAAHEKWIEELPCPVIRVDGTDDVKLLAAEIAGRFYVKRNEPLRVEIIPLNTLKKYRFSVIYAQYRGKWLFVRHKERQTWETAGGHIETSETPIDAAKRELFEETGAVEFDIFPAFDYAVYRETEFAFGQVFFADVNVLGKIPKNSEMAEVREFDDLPAEQTYPLIQPILYEKMRKWLGLDWGAKEEFWDVYDENRNLTGRTHKRGEELPKGDYHLVVCVWVINGKEEVLITRRALRKIGWPGVWERTCGSAVAGEDSISAAMRECREETGISLIRENGELFLTFFDGNSIYDSYLFRQEFDIADVVLQEGETIDAKKASFSDIADMLHRGEFIKCHDFDALREVLYK